MALRGALQRGPALLPLASAASLHASALAPLAIPQSDDQQQMPRAAPPPPPPPPPPARGPSAASSTALTVPPRQEPFLHRTLQAAAGALHRLLTLVSSLRHLGANESYVHRYLASSLGFDSFTLEYLHVTRPALFRLSVARDIEPVAAWLRSQGIQGEALVELVRHTPAILSASVDEQLEPLAALVRAAGGSPGEVLRSDPGLAAVPVPHLKGTRHVLRQLGVPDEDISLVLVSLPDLYAQLAMALHRLFQDFGVAAWKLQARQRRQLAGTVHRHMMRWNKPVPAAPTAGHHRPTAAAAAAAAAAAPASGPQPPAYASDSDGEGPAPPPRRSRLRGGLRHRPGHLLATSYLLDSELFQRLKRVQAAIEALSLQEEAPEDWEAAAGELAHAVQELEELA